MRAPLVAVVVCVLWAPALVRADERAEALALIDKAIKAMGDPDQVAKLQVATWKVKGSAQEDGQQVDLTIDGTSQGLTKHRLEFEANAGGAQQRILIVINGDNAWAQVNGMMRDVPKEVIPSVTNLFHTLRACQAPVLLKDPVYTLAPLGEVKVGDRPALGLRASHKDFRDVELYFDKEKGHLLRCILRLPNMPNGQDVEWEVLFGDYKELNGIKHFTTATFSHDGKKVFTLEVTEVKSAGKLDESTFAKP
jgi:hypothetical protein